MNAKSETAKPKNNLTTGEWLGCTALGTLFGLLVQPILMIAVDKYLFFVFEMLVPTDTHVESMGFIVMASLVTAYLITFVISLVIGVFTATRLYSWLKNSKIDLKGLDDGP